MAAFSLIKSKFGRLDITVNNAGLAKNAPLLDGSTENWREMLEVNVLAVTIIGRESYQLMQHNEGKQGHIINIGSLGGHRLPGHVEYHFYSATKFAVKALTEALRREVRAAKTSIRVTHISPGFVETEFAQRFENKDYAQKVYSSVAALQPDDIAKLIVNVLSQPDRVNVDDIVIRPSEQYF